MSAFKLIYMVICFMADLQVEADYETYQRWCETTVEVKAWECVAKVHS